MNLNQTLNQLFGAELFRIKSILKTLAKVFEEKLWKSFIFK